MSKKTVDIALKAGTVIVVTAASFLVMPPKLNPEPSTAVHWANVATFFAGTISILVSDQFKKNKSTRKLGIGLSALLLFLISGYEVLHSSYVMECFDNNRYVIGGKAFKDDSVKKKYEFWTQSGPEPTKRLLEAYDCTPTKIWELRDIAIPYYSMLFIYFGILSILACLINVLTSFIRQHAATSLRPE